MKIVIADDEALARLRMRQQLLELLPDAEIIEVKNGIELLDVSENFNLVLLDIQMPGMNGLEAAKVLQKREQVPAIIYTTAYEEHALSAFETPACAYLLKPVRLSKLSEALEAAAKLNSLQLQSIDKTPDERQQLKARTHIAVNMGHKKYRLAIADIVYFQAEHKYVTVRDQRGSYLIEDSLKSLEQEFAGIFLRIHRNALIREDSLEALEKQRDGKVWVKLSGIEEKLEVSRRHIAMLRKIMR